MIAPPIFIATANVSRSAIIYNSPHNIIITIFLCGCMYDCVCTPVMGNISIVTATTFIPDPFIFFFLIYFLPWLQTADRILFYIHSWTITHFIQCPSSLAPLFASLNNFIFFFFSLSLLSASVSTTNVATTVIMFQDDNTQKNIFFSLRLQNGINLYPRATCREKHCVNTHEKTKSHKRIEAFFIHLEENSRRKLLFWREWLTQVGRYLWKWNVWRKSLG